MKQRHAGPEDPKRILTTKWIAMGAVALIIILDQVFKVLAEKYLSGILTMPLIPDVFHLTYLQNDSMVFGFLGGLSDQAKGVLMIVLSVVTAAVLVGITIFLFTRRVKSKFLIFSLALIIGGGFGNLIDRVFRRYVIDYLDFRLINFSVFNFADCCVVVGTIFVMIYILFFLDKKPEGEKGASDSADGNADAAN